MIAQATSLSDQTGSSFISPTEWQYYINAEASDLYRRIAQADPDRYLRRNPTFVFPLQTGWISYSGSVGTMVVGNTVTGATSGATAKIIAAPDNVVAPGSATSPGAGTLYVSGPTGTFVSGEVLNGTGATTAPTSTSAYVAPSQFSPLPVDFWLLNRVDYIQSLSAPAVFQTILAVNQMEEDSYQFTTASFYGQGLRYRLQNNFLCFVPAPTVIGSIQFLYTPAFQNLVNQTDTLDDLSGFDDYVILGAAARALLKENNFQHAAGLLSLRETTEKELTRISQATRDKSTPATTISMRNKANGRGGGYRNW